MHLTIKRVIPHINVQAIRNNQCCRFIVRTWIGSDIIVTIHEVITCLQNSWFFLVLSKIPYNAIIILCRLTPVTSSLVLSHYCSRKHGAVRQNVFWMNFRCPSAAGHINKLPIYNFSIKKRILHIKNIEKQKRLKINEKCISSISPSSLKIIL